MIEDIKKYLSSTSVEKIDEYSCIITMPITHIFKGNPNFKFKIIKTSSGFNATDMGITYNTIKFNNVTLSNNISKKIYKLSKIFRCEIVNSEIISNSESIENLKYNLSYMIEFISIINYNAYGENIKNIEISK
ncbi:MAG: hypothetical protein IJX17_04070 [Clostridia bacterium]|nr:hypothetical protein [Clostridia bacterium]